jgi:hypothetical protein
MMRDTSAVFALAVAAGCLCSSAFAADVSKSGKYSGHYGWTFTGQVQKLGEGRVVYAGTLPGVMFNTRAKASCTKPESIALSLTMSIKGAPMPMGHALSRTQMETKSSSSGDARV